LGTISRSVLQISSVSDIKAFEQREALSWAWELLTEVYKLPADRLYVSYFEGDPKQGLEPDEETKQIWLEMGVPEDRIVKGNAKDNFWGESLDRARVSRLTWIRDGCYWSMRTMQVGSFT